MRPQAVPGLTARKTHRTGEKQKKLKIKGNTESPRFASPTNSPTNKQTASRKVRIAPGGARSQTIVQRRWLVFAGNSLTYTSSFTTTPFPTFVGMFSQCKPSCENIVM